MRLIVTNDDGVDAPGLETLAELKPSQWTEPSLCAGWSVHLAAAHILAGAEQTQLGFITGMASSGFRFNTMIDRDARRIRRGHGV